jgi:formyl-CoA transferase
MAMSIDRGMPEPALSGIRVVEVGNFMAAPFCALQLADLGADVVKVENPDGGDLVRSTGPFLDGESSGFVRLNRNKRSLALDLKSEQGKEAFRKLVRRADILVENLRPGTMSDLGLDYARLSELNPRLVYVAASGWGQDGPYAQRPGLDIMAQAMSGLMSITGEEGGGSPVKVGVPLTDLTCALYGALAALAALRVRDRTGRGQFIDVSLFEAGVSLAVWEAARYFATGEVPAPLGSAHQNSAPYQALRSSDGFFTVGATSARNWEACCEVFGLQHLVADPQFAKNHLRHQNRRALMPLIEAVTLQKPSRHWVEALLAAGVPCALLQTYDQVFHDPHLTARGFFPRAPHPKLGDVEQIGSPMRLSETPPRMARAGPLLGEHSAEVLAELGYSQEEIRRLAGAGAIRAP